MQKKLSYSDLEPYGTIWNHMEPYETQTRGKTRPKNLSYSDLEPYGSIWNRLDTSHKIMEDLLVARNFLF